MYSSITVWDQMGQSFASIELHEKTLAVNVMNDQYIILLQKTNIIGEGVKILRNYKQKKRTFYEINVFFKMG